jgi:hypothetical protein
VTSALAIVACGRAAHGQACCAGSAAVTPGRLALHEAALVGAQLKAADVFGSFDSGGHYLAAPPGASEVDFEQDLFGAVRLIDRGQAALIVPLVETARAVPGHSELGGGLGDVNLSVRYDATLAGASRTVPGIAVLAGITVPTGTPADAANLGALATGATGIGAYQFSLGAAVEQAYGPWLVGVSAFVAERTARTVGSGAVSIHERLGPQWSTLASCAYTFPTDAAIAASFAYTLEGDATIGGVDTAGTARRLPTLTLAGVYPIGDMWRLQGALYDNLPISQLGLSQPAGAGALASVVRSWM